MTMADATILMPPSPALSEILLPNISIELYSPYLRGAVVEYLERLAVVRKVAGSSPARAKRLENSHCPPSSEWVPD